MKEKERKEKKNDINISYSVTGEKAIELLKQNETLNIKWIFFGQSTTPQNESVQGIYLYIYFY